MVSNDLSPMELRRQYLKHESALLGVGSLYYLAAVAAVGVGVACACAGALSGRARVLSAGGFVIGAVCLAILGRGFRLLSSKVQWPASIISVMSLFLFPVGTLVGGYVLWLVHSASGRKVLSPEYPAVIAATPELRRKRSILGWFFICFLVLLLLIGLQIAVVELFHLKKNA